jgi:hypothetical protein
MTDETKAALQRATDALTTARKTAEREKQACLAEIATDLPDRAAETAKRVATEQPEVTRALGKDGVAKMRAALDAVSNELGQQFVAAVDEIDWPIGATYSKVENRQIHGALFKRFYRRTGSLNQVLTTHGYDLSESDPFLPQALYAESKFTAVAAALSALGLAGEEFDAAKKADDNAAVDEIWGD